MALDGVALDATPIIHFARIGELDLLGACLARHGPCVTTQPVIEEAGSDATVKPLIASMGWLSTVRVDTLEQLRVLGRFTRRLGSSDRNLGEASVLAHCVASGKLAMVDDKAARIAGLAEGVAVHGSLWFLRDAERDLGLTSRQVSQLVDDLRDSGMYLPCDGATYESWWQGRPQLDPARSRGPASASDRR